MIHFEIFLSFYTMIRISSICHIHYCSQCKVMDTVMQMMVLGSGFQYGKNYKMYCTHILYMQYTDVCRCMCITCIISSQKSATQLYLAVLNPYNYLKILENLYLQLIFIQYLLVYPLNNFILSFESTPTCQSFCNLPHENILLFDKV